MRHEIILHTYDHLIFDKEAKSYSGQKESIFNKWCCSNWWSSYRIKIDSYLSSSIKLDWTKDLNIKLDTLNIIEEKTKKTQTHWHRAIFPEQKTTVA